MTTEVKELCSCEVGSMFARVTAERKMGTRHDVFGAEKLKSTVNLNLHGTHLVALYLSIELSYLTLSLAKCCLLEIA